MELSLPFTPLAVGETDVRAFDLLADLAGETPLNPRAVVSWAGGPGAGDPAPQSLLRSVTLATKFTVVGPQGAPVTLTGEFMVFKLGPPPAAAAGGTYLVQGLFDTATRTNLSLSAFLPATPT